MHRICNFEIHFMFSFYIEHPPILNLYKYYATHIIHNQTGRKIQTTEKIHLVESIPQREREDRREEKNVRTILFSV